jgi:hypothetical protein
MCCRVHMLACRALNALPANQHAGALRLSSPSFLLPLNFKSSFYNPPTTHTSLRGTGWQVSCTLGSWRGRRRSCSCGSRCSNRSFSPPFPSLHAASATLLRCMRLFLRGFTTCARSVPLPRSSHDPSCARRLRCVVALSVAVCVILCLSSPLREAVVASEARALAPCRQEVEAAGGKVKTLEDKLQQVTVCSVV